MGHGHGIEQPAALYRPMIGSRVALPAGVTAGPGGQKQSASGIPLGPDAGTGTAVSDEGPPAMQAPVAAGSQTTALSNAALYLTAIAAHS